MKYKHRDIEITFDEDKASFTADVGGKFTRKPSLLAMQKHIDATTPSGLVAFDAYENHRNCPTVTVVRVVGVTFRASCMHRTEKLFLLSDKTTTRSVCEMTPENRKLIASINKKKADLEKITERMEAEIDKLTDAVKIITP